MDGVETKTGKGKKGGKNPHIPRPLNWGRLGLKTLKATRTTLARVIRAYADGMIDTEQYKNLVYGLNVMLGYFKSDTEADTENQIKTILNFYDDIKESDA